MNSEPRSHNLPKKGLIFSIAQLARAAFGIGAPHIPGTPFESGHAGTGSYAGWRGHKLSMAQRRARRKFERHNRRAARRHLRGKH